MYLTSRPSIGDARASWPDDVELHPAIEQEMAARTARARDVVQQGAEVAGPVIGAADEVLVIRGRVRGSIDCQGGVIVAHGGWVQGSIKADFVQVAGRVERPSASAKVEVTGVLVVMATGALSIDACAGAMHIAYGSGINGALEHRGVTRKEADPVEQSRAGFDTDRPTSA